MIAWPTVPLLVLALGAGFISTLSGALGATWVLRNTKEAHSAGDYARAAEDVVCRITP